MMKLMWVGISRGLVVFSAALAASCGGDAAPSGAGNETDADTDADVQPDVPLFDTGSEADVAADSATEDAGDDALDAADVADIVDVADGSGDQVGTPCEVDADCLSGDCIDLAAGDTPGICSEICGDDTDCPEGFDCVLVVTSGADAERRCLPVDYCADGDADEFGVGPGCLGVDCNDEDDAVNLGVDEVCDGIDNDCDEETDENSVDIGADCTTGFQGVCSNGREQCIEGVVQCAAFNSPAEEVCDGLDNDCDGSIDEDVLLEGYVLVDGVCEPVACGAVPDALANSTLAGVTSTNFGGQVVYRCNAGFAVAGASDDAFEVTRTCGALGEWEPASGICSAIECGAVPAPVANARLLSVDRTTFDGSASYACNEGYRVSVTGTERYEVSCEASGTWSASPSCEPLSCGALTAPANGSVATPTGVEYTDVAVYSCNSGYVLSGGTSSRTCDSTGTWTGTPAICSPVSCGVLSNPPNGSVSLPDGSTLGATAQYRCDAGYALAGPETRTCQAVGTWSGVATLCEPVSCGPLSAPANGSVTTPTGLDYQDEATYFCNAGYVLAGGTPVRRCDATGAWTGEQAVCEPLNCGGLEPPTNGTVTLPDGTFVGATANYACNDGYALSGTATRTCNDTRAWSGSAPTCVPTSCGVIAVVPNATATVPSATIGSTATFACNVGYVQRGGTTTTQSCDGTLWNWSGAPLVCDPVDCGPVSSPENGSVLTPAGSQYAAVAIYSCNAGYNLVGTTTRSCQASAAWSATSPDCAPIDCGAPPAVANASRTFTTTTFGSTATYACAPGFNRVGAESSGCTASGLWSPPPSCVELSCGALPNPTNGVVTTPSGTDYNDIATYSCSTGYELTASPTRVCQEAGLWSGAAPDCADVNECATPSAVCTATGNTCSNSVGSWECGCAAGYTGIAVVGGNASCVRSPMLGNPCTLDSECPERAWCPTDTRFRRCSPRPTVAPVVTIPFQFVPFGTFEQGTVGATDQERPYESTISRDYFVSRTEVTQEQWEGLTGGTNPSCFQSSTATSCTTNGTNDNGPVERVDWYSALAFANALSAAEGLTPCYSLIGCADAASGWHDGQHAGCTTATFGGLTCTGYRLLTESEWERAARAGTTGPYYWGVATDVISIGLNAWCASNSGSRTRNVGMKAGNRYGLFDMSGNVGEWVWDWVYSPSDWTEYPVGNETDYVGPASGSDRGIRGGDWRSSASTLRVAFRFHRRPASFGNDVGIRLARTVP
jgi:formylglycine-generating enzyme required for sulfatase activity